MEIHTQPINRHTQEFRDALAKWDTGLFKADEIPAFTTWEFSRFRFIAIPIDRGNVHIADSMGNNYGSWMSVDEFRKRQKSGVIADWQSLGKARLQIISDRI